MIRGDRQRGKSLRRRLLSALLLGVSPVVVLLSGALYFAVQSTIWASFDADLRARAETLSAMLEYDEDGYEFELGPHPLAHVEGGSGHLGAHTWLRLEDPRGRVLSESRSDIEYSSSPAWGPTAQIEPAPERSTTVDFAWFDDARGNAAAFRGVTLTWTPTPEPEARSAVTAGEVPAPGPVRLTLLRSTDTQRLTLRKIGAWFVALGLVTLGTAMFVAWWAVRVGLRPVASLTHDLQAIDDLNLACRIDAAALPRELRTVAARTNELLDRLERAFERERRFSANVAHELRTPLSVLIAELEVTLRNPRPAAAYRQSMETALTEARHLSQLVDRLMWLARATSGELRPGAGAVDLRAATHRVWDALSNEAALRGLSFQNDLRAETVAGDPDLWGMVMANLLANAVTYTEREGSIRVHDDHGWVFAVTDSGPSLEPEQLERVFDPFWRGNEVRSEAGVHCGVGLSLVRALAQVLGHEAAARLEPDGTITFGVRCVDR